MRIEYSALRVNKNGFSCGGTCVYAKIAIAFKIFERTCFCDIFRMARLKSFKFGRFFKERWKNVKFFKRGLTEIFYLFGYFVKIDLTVFSGEHRRTE